MKICVIGTGYVGLTTGPCLAALGHEVICTDCDSAKIELLQSGGMPLFEKALPEVVQQGVKAGRLSFTADVRHAIEACDAIFVCVGTPPDADGKASMVAIESVARQIAETASGYKLVIGKSTVPVHTGERMRRTLATYSRGRFDFDLVSNPEFLREGTGVYDFFHPDRIVVGVESERAQNLMREIYAPVLDGVFHCPWHGQTARGCGWKAPAWLVTNINSAELIKHAANSFLSLKISYANAIADLCELTGANAEEVLRGLGLDRRIGSEFLRPGIGFGGFCFPKDLSAFIEMANDIGYNFRLLREVQAINASRVEHFIHLIQQELWVIEGKTIGALGLAFKPETDDTRLSPAYAIIRELQRLGATIRAYDPQAMHKASRELPAVELVASGEEVAQGADAVLVLTEWPQFRQLDWARMGETMQRRVVFDGRNLFAPGELDRYGFDYFSIGRQPHRELKPVAASH